MNDWQFLQDSRTIPDSHKIISCYAAFNHMRIRRNGDMSPCCFSRRQERWVKDEYGLKDYWLGNLNNEYREDFLNNSLHKGCQQFCATRIKNKIIPPIVDYDWNVGDDRLEHALNPESWPRIFEFDISNLCNFACPMCMGELSSKHMLGRDKDLKKYDPNVFDDDDNLNQLVEQFVEFIPHLDEVRFVGGEPFAHKALYKICKLIAKIKPEVKIEVCTNGSIYNKKVEEICNNNNLSLSVSLDTVIPEEYKLIRVGGNYTQTMSNIQKFKDKLGSRKIKINTVLMMVNALNIDKFFEYAIHNNFKTFVNVYDRSGRTHTVDWGTKFLLEDDRQHIIFKLKNLLEKNINPITRTNIFKTIKLLENDS